MALDSKFERKRAWNFNVPWWAWPFPVGELDATQRAAIWGSFSGAPLPVPNNPWYVTDHVERSLALMIEQFKPATNLKKLITATVDQLQITENQANALVLYRSIDNAEGEQLDGVGAIVGEERLSRSDSEYRDAIKFRIFINGSSGEPETLIAVIKEMTNTTEVRYFDIFPARVLLWTNGSEKPANLREMTEQSAPTGVGVDIYMGYGTAVPFAFLTEGTFPQEGKGMNEESYTESGQPVGGQLVENIE